MEDWWQSIDSVIKFQNWMQVSIVVFLVLTAIATALTIIAANRISKLRNNEEEVQRQRLQKTEKSADDAAKANQQLRSELEKSKQEIDSLRKKTGPWKLSQEQKVEFIRNLSQGSGHPTIVASRMMDGDSYDYAEDIASALKEANWAVGLVNKSSVNNHDGIVVFPNFEDQTLPSFKLLINSLNSAGIKFTVAEISKKSIAKILPDTTYIVVGRRPK